MTTLILPTEHIAVLSVTLPPTPQHRLQAALAGALEESLLDEPADLHFALSPRAQTDMKAGQAFEVMVCNKAWLRDLVDKRTQLGSATERIVPMEASLQAAGWDLAQFDFAPRAAWRRKLQNACYAVWQAPHWRAARIAVVLLIVVQLVGINLWAWRDHAALADKRAHINRILLQTYPSTSLIVDAPAQMLRATQTLRASSGALGGQDLESQLGQLGQLGKSVTQIDYVSGSLKVAP